MRVTGLRWCKLPLTLTLSRNGERGLWEPGDVEAGGSLTI